MNIISESIMRETESIDLLSEHLLITCWLGKGEVSPLALSLSLSLQLFGVYFFFFFSFSHTFIVETGFFLVGARIIFTGCQIIVVVFFSVLF